MTKLRGAALAATIALFVLAAAACYSAGAQDSSNAAQTAAAATAAAASTATCDTPANHTIHVGSETVDCKVARVSKSQGNQITWRSDSGGNIEIVFKAKGGIVPFPNLTCPGNAPICNSGAINADASGPYDYDVWLYTGDTKKAIDPGVVIDP